MAQAARLYDACRPAMQERTGPPPRSMQPPATIPRSRPPRVLFVPVSGPHGSGELMRCLIVARALRRTAPGIESHFLVSRDAVFREAVDFPLHDCDDSPTRSTPQVVATLGDLRPDVVVFDNAGRTSQLRAARRTGARLVFTSRSSRLRWKAFRLRWLRLLDEHWIVFPEFVTGGLSAIERFKLRLAPHHRVRHLDTLFTPSDVVARRQWLRSQALEPGTYTAFVPGGRSEGRHAAGTDPAELFIAAADGFARATGQQTVVLTGRAGTTGGGGADDRLRLLPRIGPEEVQHLLADAARVVSNGGTTFVHALAHGREIVGVPLAADQARRLRRAAALGVAVAVPADPQAIATAAIELANEPARGAELRARVARLGLVNGVDEAAAALERLAHAR